MNNKDNLDLSCSECNKNKGEIFLCGEGYFCVECYDEVLKGNKKDNA